MKPAVNVGTAKGRSNGVAHTGDCRCPTCDSPISAEQYAAILGEQRTHDAEIERATEARFASREAAIRKEAAATATAALAPKLAKAEQDRRAAEQAAKAAKATFELTLKERLAQRDETAAKARVEAVNAVTEKFFGENLRLQERVQELQRMLEKKTANELGDAGEIDLFEALCEAFQADQITRVPKGVNGPDVVQRVFANGAFTGRSIIFDSKNHKSWQNKWTAKLRQDQLSHGIGSGEVADHAVLVSTAFPAGRRHLMVKDGGCV